MKDINHAHVRMKLIGLTTVMRFVKAGENHPLGETNFCARRMQTECYSGIGIERRTSSLAMEA